MMQQWGLSEVESPQTPLTLSLGGAMSPCELMLVNTLVLWCKSPLHSSPSGDMYVLSCLAGLVSLCTAIVPGISTWALWCSG